jgi:phage N-6-adenine-methyltransferase
MLCSVGAVYTSAALVKNGARKSRSRGSQTWATPSSLIERLRRRYLGGAPFDLDPAAEPATAKGAAFYTAEDDGLSLPWGGLAAIHGPDVSIDRSTSVFCNPPWGNIEPFVSRAIGEVLTGRCWIVIILVPIRADQRWFRRLERPPEGITVHVDPIRGPGRLKYEKPPGYDGVSAGQPSEVSQLWVIRAELRARDFGKPPALWLPGLEGTT